MKTFLVVLASSVLGFGAVYAYVPQRPPTIVSPAWFELPGVPLRVDGKPVFSWAEANRELRRVSRDHLYTPDFGENLARTRSEVDGPGVRIEYVPTVHRGGGERVQQVTVRAFFPKTYDWSRATPEDMVRYEIDRPSAID